MRNILACSCAGIFFVQQSKGVLSAYDNTKVVESNANVNNFASIQSYY